MYVKLKGSLLYSHFWEQNSTWL